MTIRCALPGGQAPLLIHVRSAEDALLRVRHLAGFVDTSRVSVLAVDGREYSVPQFEQAMGSLVSEAPESL